MWRNFHQLSGNDLEKIENCPLAFWECVEGICCPFLSLNDTQLLKLLDRWPKLTDATRSAIDALLDAG